MEAENFSLRWNDFEANISGGLKELRQHSEFFDVTLVVEGGAQVQAHKLILSACSPFFRHVLGSNPHQHPLLYLKGVSKEQVVSILNFMYLGEVNVAQDKLNSFLVVAEDLKVKGLTNNDPGIKSSSTKLGSPGGSSSVSELPPPPKRLKAKSSSMEDIVHIKSEPITGELPSEVGSVASPKPSGSKEPYTVADWDGGVDYHEEGEGSGYGEGVFGHLSHGGLAGNLNGSSVSPLASAGPLHNFYHDNSMMRQRRQQILQFINLNKGRLGDAYQCLICLKQVTDNSNMNKHLEFKHGAELKDYLSSLL